MSDDVRTVQMAADGAVVNVSYRRAVSLISRGLAVWAEADTAEEQEDPAPPEPQSQPQDDPKSDKGEGSGKPDKGKKQKKSDVSTPAGDGQEGASAENKPPTSE